MTRWNRMHPRRRAAPTYHGRVLTRPRYGRIGPSRRVGRAMVNGSPLRSYDVEAVGSAQRRRGLRLEGVGPLAYRDVAAGFQPRTTRRRCALPSPSVFTGAGASATVDTGPIRRPRTLGFGTASGRRRVDWAWRRTSSPWRLRRYSPTDLPGRPARSEGTSGRAGQRSGAARLRAALIL